MKYTLDRVVPWGRSLDEYTRMFTLTDSDIAKSILGCADGPASFNCELTASGKQIVSCDPIYQFSTEQIRQRISATAEKITEYAQQNADEFLWSDEIPDSHALRAYRLSTMEKFLDDFELGKSEGRYINAAAPSLPFANHQFQLSVCSHFLFLYSEQLSEQFHLEVIHELLRVSAEIRIFPLLELGSRQSRHLDPVVSKLRTAGVQVEIEEVEYEFQRGGNQMMRVRT